MTRISQLIDQIGYAHNYTARLLDSTKLEDWFRQPSEGVTHIAWQVGHLAMAQYRLTLERIRGAQPEDQGLISTDFLKLFNKGTIPHADVSKYPRAEEILATFDRVHQQSLVELQQLADAELDQPVLQPHALFKTKEGSLLWCMQHEMIHAGQIGLLRRLLGYGPNR